MHHPKYMELLEENILLKKRLHSGEEWDSESVRMNINETNDRNQVSVSDIYSEFGMNHKQENTNISEKKTVVTSLPDQGSKISSKLVDFQVKLEETLGSHELIEQYKNAFGDFLAMTSDSDDSDAESIEILSPPKVKREVVDLTNSWLSGIQKTDEKAKVDLNDPFKQDLLRLQRKQLFR